MERLKCRNNRVIHRIYFPFFVSNIGRLDKKLFALKERKIHKILLFEPGVR